MESMNSSNRPRSESDRGRGTLLRRLMSISMAAAVSVSACVWVAVCGMNGWRLVSVPQRRDSRRGSSRFEDYESSSDG